MLKKMVVFFFETSAKTGENINHIFNAIAQKLPKNVQTQAADAIQILPQEEAGSDGCKC